MKHTSFFSASLLSIPATAMLGYMSVAQPVHQQPNCLSRGSSIDVTDPPGHVIVPLTIHDRISTSPATSSQTIPFGVDPAATLCMDTAFGEFGLPPVPFPGRFDVRFLAPRSLSYSCFEGGSWVDIRQYIDSTQIDTYRVRVQPGPAGYPMTLSWPDLSNSYAYPITMRYAEFGSTRIVYMQEVDSVVITDSNTTILRIFAPGPGSHSGNLFESAPVDFPGAVGGLWGDYDNDHDLDLLVLGSVESTAVHRSRIFRNDAGTFVDIGVDLAPGNKGEWGDYDGDGDLDIVECGATSPNNGNAVTKIYRNDGGGAFTDINAPLIGVVGNCTWGDYDNDGDLDLLVGGSPDNGNSFSTKMYRNDGATFNEINSGLPGMWKNSFAWGDYDNDGDLDLVMMGYGALGEMTKIFRNDAGTFTDVEATVIQAANGVVTWGYDYFSVPTLLVSGSQGSFAYTKLYHYGGGSLFYEVNSDLPQVCNGDAEWRDFDQDGDMDIVISGSSNVNGDNSVTKLFRSNGGTFTDVNLLFPGLHLSTVNLGDYDNDGDLDFALAGASSSSLPHEYVLLLYRNTLGSNSFAPNTPPQPPLNAISIVEGSGLVVLQWALAHDNESSTLTYNLRVGTTPGGSEIISPQANTSTGRRFLVRPGSMGYRTSLEIRDLPDGTYYWSVQAVDHGYEGSSFIVEQTFQSYGAIGVYRTFSQTDYAKNSRRMRPGVAPTAANVRDETFMRMEWFTNGLSLGIPRPDSVQDYGWLRWRRNLMRLPRFLPHSGTARGFDYYVAGHPWHNSRYNPSVRYHDNHLAGEQYILKFNIGASDVGISPRGFGDLIFNDPTLGGNPCNGMTVRQIMAHTDSALTFFKKFSSSHFSELDSCLSRINRAFLGPITSYTIDPLTVPGTRSLRQISYLHPNPAAHPVVVPPLEAYPDPGDPNSYTLLQNYPNPFNPVTAIDFNVPSPSWVTLKVFNMLGQDIVTLIDHSFLEEGMQSIDFDGTMMPSGIYFSRLEVVDGASGLMRYKQVRKMLLVK